MSCVAKNVDQNSQKFMGSCMIDKKKTNNLREKIDQILWNDWDPIGVNDIPEAKGEYTSYADHIVSRLLNNKEDKKAILDYLFWAEVENMGLGTGNANRNIIDNKNVPIVEKIFKSLLGDHELE